MSIDWFSMQTVHDFVPLKKKIENCRVINYIPLHEEVQRVLGIAEGVGKTKAIYNLLLRTFIKNVLKHCIVY